MVVKNSICEGFNCGAGRDKLFDCLDCPLLVNIEEIPGRITIPDRSLYKLQRLIERAVTNKSKQLAQRLFDEILRVYPGAIPKGATY